MQLEAGDISIALHVLLASAHAMDQPSRFSHLIVDSAWLVQYIHSLKGQLVFGTKFIEYPNQRTEILSTPTPCLKKINMESRNGTNWVAVYSNLDSLLHEEHCNQKSKQLTGNSGEPVDERARTKYCKNEQQNCSPYTDPARNTKTSRNISTPVRVWNKFSSQYYHDKYDLPTSPSEEQAAAEVGPVLGKAEHESVHEHCWLSDAEDQQRLSSHNGVDDATQGCGCQRLHCCEKSICTKEIWPLNKTCLIIHSTETNIKSIFLFLITSVPLQLLSEGYHRYGGREEYVSGRRQNTEKQQQQKKTVLSKSWASQEHNFRVTKRPSLSPVLLHSNFQDIEAMMVPNC
jgi:hypothetical protein